MAVIKDVVSNFKVSLKGKPRLWFEMQYPTSADEPKTKEAYEKVVASFITEHNPKRTIKMSMKTHTSLMARDTNAPENYQMT